MKHAREYKGKPDWDTILMQSLQWGEVGHFHRAVQQLDGRKAISDHVAIQCVERNNFEAFKIVVPHLSLRHYQKVLHHCASGGHIKELELCLQYADSADVDSAAKRVLWSEQHAALPVIVEHLKRHVYSRDQRARLVEDAARSGNAPGLQTLLKLYPQSNSTVYREAVHEGIYSENTDVLTLLLPSIERLTPQQCARALEYAAKYNGHAIAYLLEHAVDPDFDTRDVWEIVISSNVSVQSVQQLVPYWSMDVLAYACQQAHDNTDIKEFLITHLQKQVLLSHVQSPDIEHTASLRARKM